MSRRRPSRRNERSQRISHVMPSALKERAKSIDESAQQARLNIAGWFDSKVRGTRLDPLRAKDDAADDRTIEVRRAAPAPLLIETGRILVVGVYLGDRPHLADLLAEEFRTAGDFGVEQRWAALGTGAGSGHLLEVTDRVQTTPLPKFVLINELLADVDLSGYDLIVISDDDIDVQRGFLGRYLDLVRRLGFALAQPARTPDSYIDHPIVTQQLGVTARRTLFVEIGPLFSIHRSAFDLLIPFDPASPMGWGYENVWAHKLARQGLPMGIVDVTPVRHRLRPPVQNYAWADADRQRHDFLEAREHLPLDDCMRVLDVSPLEIGREDVG